MRKLYRFKWNVVRQGVLEGLFVADSSEVKDAIGKIADFGEVLGKHSKIAYEIEPSDIEVLSTDQKLIDMLIELRNTTDISGYNPLHYAIEEGEYYE